MYFFPEISRLTILLSFCEQQALKDYTAKLPKYKSPTLFLQGEQLLVAHFEIGRVSNLIHLFVIAWGIGMKKMKEQRHQIEQLINTL